VGEGQDAAVAPGDDLAVEQKFAGDFRMARRRRESFVGAVHRAGVDGDAVGGFVDLRADAVELVLGEETRPAMDLIGDRRPSPAAWRA
jgi:hypothetical protein